MTTDEPFLDFKCPSCGEMNSYPQDAAGLVRECVHCNTSLVVPSDGGDTGHLIPLPIQTERLVLRRFAHEDWEDMVGAMFDLEQEVVAWLERIGRVQLSTMNEPFHLAIEHTAAGRVIGYVELWHNEASFRELMVTIVFSEPANFHAFATETLTGLLKFGFEGLRLHRITTRAMDSEPEHHEAITRAGLRCEGEFVKNLFHDGEWRSTFWFAMLEEEYFGKASTPAAAS